MSMCPSRHALVAVLLCFASIVGTAQAEHTDCIANYVTDFSVTRSIDDENRLLQGLPPIFQEVLEARVRAGFQSGGWSSPFAQARYDDLLYTLDFLTRELDQDFTPALKFAVIDQFTSPVTYRDTLKPLRSLILGKPEKFTDLFRRHLGASKYWQRFGLCWANSPYTVYVQWYAEAYAIMHSATSSDLPEDWHEERASTRMRYLGGERPIIGRSYLPDMNEPRVRFAAPPCGLGQAPRNIEFRYDAGTKTWVRTEPYLPIGTWYARGFEDPLSKDRWPFAANTPEEFAVIQKQLVEQFEAAQMDVGLPLSFPSDVDLTCSSSD